MTMRKLAGWGLVPIVAAGLFLSCGQQESAPPAAAASPLESELRRRGQAEVRLSPLYTVYWEYVEKARRFIREKGDSFLGQGSEPNSAMERIKQYGLVRASDFTGLLDGKTTHDHGPLFREFRDYLSGLAARKEWDVAGALA